MGTRPHGHSIVSEWNRTGFVDGQDMSRQIGDVGNTNDSSINGVQITLPTCSIKYKGCEGVNPVLVLRRNAHQAE